MKKVLASIAILAILALAGCGKKAAAPSNADTQETAGYAHERMKEFGNYDEEECEGYNQAR
ncbi:hypothetical protein A3F06_02810 [candidate division TM6 bacterium RIFCSPHIGHO2_12_FULL_36_22]|nr:MAG: hypothetical protein A3F06_02810 [candidate division TM6 bacterium RIFCSPHIGHO2_12_FULL_36_22]